MTTARTVVSRTVDLRVLLVDAIDRLRGQHRAGITPSYGQVEDLFELSDRLRIQVAVEAPDLPLTTIPTCSFEGCGRDAEVKVHGFIYCRRHGEAVEQTTVEVETELQSIVRARVLARDAAPAAWPASGLIDRQVREGDLQVRS